MKLKFLLLIVISYGFNATIFAQDITGNAKTIIPPAKTTVNVDPEIKMLVKAKFAQSNHDNYKIQLYYGTLTKAHSVLSKFNSHHSEWTGKIEYETPNYKVWVGNYRTRLEADKALMKISENFPHAFIFKPER